MSLHFTQPMWLGGVLLAPLLGIACWHARRQRERAAQALSGLRDGRWRREESGTALLGTLGLALVLSWLAGPRWSATAPEPWQGEDLVVVLDASASMWAEDVAPSRLERARSRLEPLGDPLGRQRMALVSFAGDSRVECPWTLDRAAFQRVLRDVQPTTQALGGSNLAAALARGLELLEPDANGALLVVSDGDWDHDPAAYRQVVEEARRRAVPVHAMCIGTAQGARLAGSDVGPVQRAAPDALRDLAERTRGRILEGAGTVLPPPPGATEAGTRAGLPLGQACAILGFLAWLCECWWRGRR